jgi:hypothetical protein
MPEVLKATKTREITKESVTEAETLVVNGVSVSKPATNPMQAGDFYFRPTLVQHLVKLSWFDRTFRRRKESVINEQVTTIVISCPVCGLPILTNPFHKIIKRNPLTLDREIACPYAPQGIAGAHSFSIKDGTIMPA